MLGIRRVDEEGSHIRKTWKAWLLLQRNRTATGGTSCWTSADVEFRKDGGFARVVAADNVKIVRSKMFVRTSEDGTPLTEQGREAIAAQLKQGPNDESKFTIVYIPPHFRTRILLFIYLLWVSSTVALFACITIPRKSFHEIYHTFCADIQQHWRAVMLGRIITDVLLPTSAHDTYSLLVGLHVMLIVTWLYKKAERQWRRSLRLKDKSKIAANGPVETSNSCYWSAALVTSFHIAALGIQAFIVLPLLLGALLQLFVFYHIDNDQIPTLRLGMAWSFGLVLLSLASSISSPNRLADLHAALVQVRPRSVLDWMERSAE